MQATNPTHPKRCCAHVVVQSDEELLAGVRGFYKRINKGNKETMRYEQANGKHTLLRKESEYLWTVSRYCACINS